MQHDTDATIKPQNAAGLPPIRKGVANVAEYPIHEFVILKARDNVARKENRRGNRCTPCCSDPEMTTSFSSALSDSLGFTPSDSILALNEEESGGDDDEVRIFEHDALYHGIALIYLHGVRRMRFCR